MKDPDSLDQELMNIVIRGMALKQLEGRAKDHCQKGHEMEAVYSQQLLDDDSFPWGTIDEIVHLGLVQKDGLPYAKGSVDRCIGVSEIDCKETLLTEYKCRVSIDRVREEEDRIEELRLSGQMSDDSIYCEVDSDDPDRFMYVKDEKELGQILHHAFVFSKTNCLHSVGNPRELMSCTKMNFALDLLEAYHKVLRLLFERCLKPFFEGENV